MISIPFGTALGLARSRLHANPKSTAPCGMSSALAAAETTGGSESREAGISIRAISREETTRAPRVQERWWTLVRRWILRSGRGPFRTANWVSTANVYHDGRRDSLFMNAKIFTKQHLNCSGALLDMGILWLPIKYFSNQVPNVTSIKSHLKVKFK